MILREKELHIISFNRDKDIIPESIIPIGRIRGPVLLLSSRHDEVWPSYESAVYMEENLRESDFPYPHKHIAFDYMSHAAITKLPWIYRMAFKSERRHPKECGKDRKVLRKALLYWINKVWE